MRYEQVGAEAGRLLVESAASFDPMAMLGAMLSASLCMKMAAASSQPSAVESSIAIGIALGAALGATQGAVAPIANPPLVLSPCGGMP